MTGADKREERPDTALGEVFREAEDAEKHGEDAHEKAAHDKGEAGDTITPSVGAQEQAHGE
ncbi:hypothetical protein ACFW1F_30030 [Streptomyces bungoensis]|uniref:hypothetical protein n=1 Tax=Streptomyces bungoensis TaxID=285568 RepID=UPI00341D6C59